MLQNNFFSFFCRLVSDRSVLRLALVSLLLAGCASSGETRLLTVEQVEARQVIVAQKQAAKQQKLAAKREAEQAVMAARKEAKQALQNQQKERETAASMNQSGVLARKNSNKQSRLGSLTDKLGGLGKKLWPFGKKKEERSTRSERSVITTKADTTTDGNTVSAEAAMAPNVTAKQTISHPQAEKRVTGPINSIDVASGLDGQTIELVGVLSVVKSADCALSSGCGPEFSLLASDMRTRVYAMTGNIGEELKGRLIAVKGRVDALPADLASQSGYQGIAEILDVQQYVAISDYAYYPFLSQAAAQYSQSEYGCNLLWDKSYTWYLDGRQPRYSVRLTNSRSVIEPKPYLELDYDGKSRQLVSSTLVPNELNPCEL